MPFLHAPQLVTVVVAVHHQDLPGILVDIKGAPLVDVPLARLERRVVDPGEVVLILRVVRLQAGEVRHVAIRSEQHVDARPGQELIDRWNEIHPTRISFFHLVLRAIEL